LDICLKFDENLHDSYQSQTYEGLKPIKHTHTHAHEHKLK